ncbi:hypothetical protein H1Q63_29135 [Desmonostoc muscorum CCALA 125]|nr:hypothetical protein [Desmonostoc muscorum CCALA 125]
MTILYNAYVLLLKWSVLVEKVNVEDQRRNFEDQTRNVEVQRLNLRFFLSHAEAQRRRENARGSETGRMRRGN